MGETQETISAWAKATFPGGDDLSPRHAIRLLEEVVELCLAAGATPTQIHRATLAGIGDRPDHAVYAESPEKTAEEMADAAICLDVLAHRRGVVLRDEVDKKMRINRSRRWAVGDDGTGYHIKDSSSPAGDAPR